MGANPILGIFFHWLGGFASGSFYVPFKAVKNWSWEVYWLAGGVFSWIVAPWVFAFIMIPQLPHVLGEQPFNVLAWTFFWGMMWGFGGLTYGLTMRYLGMSLGTAIVLGLTALFGTYMPPIVNGTLGAKLQTVPGHVILIGTLMTLIGIVITGSAGLSKEREMNQEQKRKTIAEFDLRKGILLAMFSGIMSSSFAYGLTSGNPISDSAIKFGASTIWSGLPKLIVVMAGGFVTNFVWCSYLLKKNRTLHQYISRGARQESRSEAFLGKAPIRLMSSNKSPAHIPLLWNYFFCALAGTTWYFQFFFYTMGETQMGNYRFSSWTLHMASIIIFGSLWGLFLKEWKDTSGLSKFLLALALFTLLTSTTVIGYGNLLGLQIGEN
jgi:L-rhamnose-H+ transport protein